MMNGHYDILRIIASLLSFSVVVVSFSSSSSRSSSSSGSSSTSLASSIVGGGSGGGTVNVVVERGLRVGPAEARDAWLLYQFQRGADLPGVWIQNAEGNNDDGRCRRRIIHPVLMEEILVEEKEETSNDNDENSNNNKESTTRISYKVTDFGLLRSELEEGSHTATVCFVPTDNDDNDDGACIMKWEVTFEAIHRRALWEGVTKQNIQLASDNLVCYTATPNLYTRRTRLLLHAKDNSVSGAMDAWVRFVWKSGGGLPCQPPVDLDEQTRMYVPPFLKERLLSVDKDRGEIRYRVINPGWLATYPVHSHIGRVRFVPVAATDDKNEAAAAVEMTWHVQVRPFRNCEAYVRAFTSGVVSVLSQNLRVHLAEPGVTVPLYPPRGGGGGKPLAEIPKDTWLGRVLAAHLVDRRPVTEQTLAMLKPWTWGVTEEEEREEEEEWTVGFMPPQ